MKTFGSRTASSLAVAAALSMMATPAFARGPEYTPDRPQSDGSYSGDDDPQADPPPADSADNGDPDADAPRSDNPDGDYSGSATAHDDSPGADYANGDSARDEGQDDRYPESDRSAAENTQRPRGAGNFDAAVDACAGEIEHGNNHLGLVESVHHMNDRYSVEGKLENGRDFACSVDESGQVRSLDIDGHGMI